MKIPTQKEFIRGVKEFEKHEKRNAMYKVAEFLIRHFWGKPSDIADGLGVLLLTWNQAFYRYGIFDFKELGECIKENFQDLKSFRTRKIASLSESDEGKIKTLFNEFMDALQIASDNKMKGKKSPVAVSKALHLLAPNFFPLWDDKIARAYGCYYCNNPAEKYVLFCRIVKSIVKEVKDYKHPDRTLLKLIDEYNYSKYTKGWISKTNDCRPEHTQPKPRKKSSWIKKILAVTFLLVSLGSSFLYSQQTTTAIDLIPYRKGDKWGFCDRSKNVVISIKYDDVSTFSEGFALVELAGRYGFVDKTGKEVVPLRYDEARTFSEGLAEVNVGAKPDKYGIKRGGKWGFIDKRGKEVIFLVYDDVRPFSEGLAAVKLNDKWGFIDKTGKVVIPLKYDESYSFKDEIALVELNGKYGYIDKESREFFDTPQQKSVGTREEYEFVDFKDLLTFPGKYKGKNIRTYLSGKIYVGGKSAPVGYFFVNFVHEYSTILYVREELYSVFKGRDGANFFGYVYGEIVATQFGEPVLFVDKMKEGSK